jgi:hypothetical protein
MKAVTVNAALVAVGDASDHDGAKQALSALLSNINVTNHPVFCRNISGLLGAQHSYGGILASRSAQVLAIELASISS